MLSRMLLTTAAMAMALAMPVAAFSDTEFCAVANQMAVAAEQDVGIWIDRKTRSAGITVDCAKKVIQFKRFTYLPGAELNDGWKQRTAASWNSQHCLSTLWREAVKNSWKMVLGVWSADGGHASMVAECE